MSENQLTVTPEPNAEEAVVVDRFIQASRELLPTVQISLAKRIMCAGSDRMLCLAAHTTVPINENELASVSDLALRLSDGTNVRLSVSFFNDAIAAQPFTMPFVKPSPRAYARTSSYDPERYRVYSDNSKDSRLGLALSAVTLMVVSALALSIHSPAVLHVPLLQDSTQQRTAVRPQVKPAKIALLPPTAFTSPVLAPPQSGAEPRAKHQQAHRSAKSNHAAATSVISNPSRDILVPPPPPFTPTISFPQAPGAFQGESNQLRGAAPAKKSKPLAVTAKSAVKSDSVPIQEQIVPVKALARPKPTDPNQALPSELMPPMPANSHMIDLSAGRARAVQSERAEAPNRVVSDSSTSNVDQAMHLAPLPGGD